MSTTFPRNNSHTAALSDVTPEEIALLKRIKISVSKGHDVEIKRTPDGRLKVLEVSKKNIAIG